MFDCSSSFTCMHEKIGQQPRDLNHGFEPGFEPGYGQDFLDYQDWCTEVAVVGVFNRRLKD